MSNKELAVLIAAAGSSSRLGRPKQLIPWKKTTLLGHSILCAKAVSDQVYVVLGANEGQILSTVSIENHIHFPDWQNGMGASISFGVKVILKQLPDLDQLLVMVCDQPYVTPELLKELVDVHDQSNRMITASAYNETIGVPAIFSKEVFPDLLSLTGERGAKGIISNHATSWVDFPKGSIDIDTVSDIDDYLH